MLAEAHAEATQPRARALVEDAHQIGERPLAASITEALVQMVDDAARGALEVGGQRLVERSKDPTQMRVEPGGEASA